MKIIALLLVVAVSMSGLPTPAGAPPPGVRVLTGSASEIDPPQATPIGGPTLYKVMNPEDMDRCPFNLAKSRELCQGLHSTCWSMGGPDVDCAKDELCCFDGCVNVCHKPVQCSIVNETRYEDVEKEECKPHQVEVCGEDICTNECSTIQVPHETTTYEDNCQTVPGECETRTVKDCFKVVEYKEETQQQEKCQDEQVEECHTENVDQCENVSEESCEDVTVQVPESYEEDDCHVDDTTMEIEAYEVSEQVCDTECEDVMHEVCEEEPVCEEQMELMPQEQQVCREVPKQVCHEQITPCTWMSSARKGKKYLKRRYKRHLSKKTGRTLCTRTVCEQQMHNECSTKTVPVLMPWKRCTKKIKCSQVHSGEQRCSKTNCRMQTVTKHREVPRPQKICTKVTKERLVDSVETRCHTETMPHCRQVPEKKCQFRTEQVCRPEEVVVSVPVEGEQCNEHDVTECPEPQLVCNKVAKTDTKIVAEEKCEEQCRVNCSFVTEEKCTLVIVTMEFIVPVEKCD